ncbi:hypothetical protein Tcan_18382 [Toxocara canis]|uniref:Uncharacterized protein n=1 Tax=Toxocara canis TaxID=6265 RepID=A0A0B2UYN6_TOXCA|nr:hypothetical protein Tcan_18382 [Toxocara canis]
MENLLERTSYSAKLVAPGSTNKRRTSVPVLLHQREINGKSVALSSVRAWNRLCHLQMPTMMRIGDGFFDLLKDGIFLGMSNDSGYIVSILDSSSFGRYGGMEVGVMLTVMHLSSARLIPVQFFFTLFALFQ